MLTLCYAAFPVVPFFDLVFFSRILLQFFSYHNRKSPSRLFSNKVRLRLRLRFCTICKLFSFWWKERREEIFTFHFTTDMKIKWFLFFPLIVKKIKVFLSPTHPRLIIAIWPTDSGQFAFLRINYDICVRSAFATVRFLVKMTQREIRWFIYFCLLPT